MGGVGGRRGASTALFLQIPQTRVTRFLETLQTADFSLQIDFSIPIDFFAVLNNMSYDFYRDTEHHWSSSTVSSMLFNVKYKQ